MAQKRGTFTTRLKNAFNVFTGKEELAKPHAANANIQAVMVPYHNRPSYNPGPRTLLNAVYNRIALEVSARTFRQVKLNDKGHILEFATSGLNECLRFRPNIDQTPSQFIQDLTQSLMEWGDVAIVAVDTDVKPNATGAFEVLSLRVGQIMAYQSDSVRLKVYNERTGQREEIIVPKAICAIVQNPHYAVMNLPNGTLSRLEEKLTLLDKLDKQTSSGKLDLILQLPYTIRSEKRSEEAEKRLDAIKRQLTSSQYGIAYVDGTERITQLNRPVENNLLHQIEHLTEELYNRLGMSKEVFNGTANSAVLSNFQNQTVQPLVTVICEALTAVFLTKTARTQGHRVIAIRDYFRDVTTVEMGGLIDTLVRNEIVSPNELRNIMGFVAADDPTADELKNANINPKEPEPIPMEEL